MILVRLLYFCSKFFIKFGAEGAEKVLRVFGVVVATRRPLKSSKIGVFAARRRRAAKKMCFWGSKTAPKIVSKSLLEGGQTNKEWDVRFKKNKEWTPYDTHT